MDLYVELVHLAQTFEREGLDYALVGGLAVAVWGLPRATQDIDLLVIGPRLRRSNAVSHSRLPRCALAMAW